MDNVSRPFSAPVPGDGARLDVTQVAEELKQRGHGIDFEHHDVVASTQDVARQAVALGGERPLLVVAQRQTGGRGRRGRQWIHVPGGLAFTIAAQLPSDALPAWPTMAASVGVARAVETYTGVALGIKWPNDLVHGMRKTGGVLAEVQRAWTFVGVGLNVNAAPGTAAGTPTVAIAELAGGVVNINGLLIEVADAMLTSLFAAQAERPMLHQAWVDLSVVLGRRVVVDGSSGHLYGRVASLPEDGSLHLVQSNGIRHAIHSGDVSLRLEAGA